MVHSGTRRHDTHTMYQRQASTTTTASLESQRGSPQHHAKTARTTQDIQLATHHTLTR